MKLLVYVRLMPCVQWRITGAGEKKDRLNLLASDAISKRNSKVRDVYFEAGPKFKQQL